MEDLIASFGSLAFSNTDIPPPPDLQMEDLIASFGSLTIRNTDNPPPPDPATASQTSLPKDDALSMPKTLPAEPSKPALPIFYFTASSTSGKKFRPRFTSKIHDFRKVYVEAKQVTQKSISASRRSPDQLPRLPPPVPLEPGEIWLPVRLRANQPAQASSSLKPRSQTFTLANLESNIKDYTHFCRWESKRMQTLDVTSEKSARTPASSVPKCKFTSHASKRVALRNSARKIKSKINFPPRGNCSIVMETRKQLYAGTLASASLYRFPIDWRPTGIRPAPSLIYLFPTALFEPNLSNRKRKSLSPHHVPGSSLIDPREFALLEKKICGEHRSKKRRNPLGLAPRTPSKQVIFDILSNKDAKIAWFSEFLLSKFHPIDFMKGPFKNSTPRTLKTFTCFARLPDELQNLIFEHALPARQILKLRLDLAKGNFETGFVHLDRPSLLAQWPIPSDRFMDCFLYYRMGFLTLAQEVLASASNEAGEERPEIKLLKRMIRALNDPAEENLHSENLDELSLHNWNYLDSYGNAKGDYFYLCLCCLQEQMRQLIPLLYLWINVWKIPDWYHLPQTTFAFDAVSALLQTCQRSRAQVQLSYKQVFRRSDGSTHYCNFETDAIYLGNWLHESRSSGPAPRPRLPLVRKSRLWTSKFKTDMAKVRHLVIGNTFVERLSSENDEDSENHDMGDGKISYRDLPIIFPNLRRFTFEISELPKIQPNPWTMQTSTGSRQRLTEDVWFAHLPLSPMPSGEEQKIGKFLDNMRSITESCPLWKPAVEVREMVSNEREFNSFGANDDRNLGQFKREIKDGMRPYLALAQEWKDED